MHNFLFFVSYDCQSIIDNYLLKNKKNEYLNIMFFSYKKEYSSRLII